MPRLALFFSVFVGVASCTSLPDIPRGTCGNQIVDTAEDCDSFGDTTTMTVCRPPGVSGACRFDCTLKDGARPSCPSGWACGGDSLCRAASGAFAALPVQIRSEAGALALYDYDGDGLKDIRARSASDVQIFYSDPGGTFGQSFTIPALDSRPASGLLTTTKANDIALSVGGSIAVWRGTSSRTMIPTAYPSFPIPNDPLSFMVVNGLNDVSASGVVTDPGARILIFSSVAFSGAAKPIPNISLQTANAKFTPLFFLQPTQTPAAMVGQPALGSIVEDPLGSPCDELVLAFAAESQVHVLSPCRSKGASSELNLPDGNQVKLPDVTFPPGITVGSRLLLTDLNADGHLDLLVEGVDSSEPIALAAYGQGDGTFNSKLPLPGPGKADNRAVQDTLTGMFPSFPLAVGQLTDDTLLDWVDPLGIVLKTPRGQIIVPAPSDAPWDEAHILDLNGNGAPDVIAGSVQRIDFYNGVKGPTLDHFSYPVEGAASHFAFGDLDGDTLTDVAFRQEGDALKGDALSVLFGRPFKAPEPPALIGRLGQMQQVSVAVLANAAAGGISDIGVLSRSIDQKSQFISILNGSTDRQLQSPFTLTHPEGLAFKQASALSFAVGQFTADAQPSLAAIAVEETALSAAATSVDYYLWLAPVKGEAELAQSTLTRSPRLDVATLQRVKSVASRFDWRATVMTSVDLDAPSPGGIEEALVLSPPFYGGKQKAGQLLISRVVSGAFKTVTTIPIGVEKQNPLWSVRHGDLNADGTQDVLVLADFKNGPAVQVFWNRSTGSLDEAHSAMITLPAGVVPTEFALLNADADPALEVVFLTSGGVYLAKLTAKGDAFGPATAMPGLSSGKGIAAGDVTGDGVGDVIIVGDGILQIFAGVPVLK